MDHQILVHYTMHFSQRPEFLATLPFTLAQDNDATHMSGKVKKYLASKANVRSSKVKIMEWPSQSPDSNALELLSEECDKMPAAKMEKLVNRMSALCQAIIKAGGGYFIQRNVSVQNKIEKVSKQTVYEI